MYEVIFTKRVESDWEDERQFKPWNLREVISICHFTT